MRRRALSSHRLHAQDQRPFRDAALLTRHAQRWHGGDLVRRMGRATIDPDLYQTYHSSGIVGRGGLGLQLITTSTTQTLDGLIVDARKSDDQAYRRIDLSPVPRSYRGTGRWNCRSISGRNCTVFSAKRLDTSTITPDITTFWGWTKQIESIRMKIAKREALFGKPCARPHQKRMAGRKFLFNR